MKLLLLMRHATAEPGGHVGDHDRRLSPEGRAEAAAVAAGLDAAGLRPQRVLCSSARRAQETLEAFAEVVAADAARVTERLYLAPAADLLAEVRDVDDGTERLLVIGHNPGLQRLAVGLAAEDDGPALERFPPAALAVLRFATDRWAEIADHAGRLVHSARG